MAISALLTRTPTAAPSSLRRDDDLLYARRRLDEAITNHAGDQHRWAQELNVAVGEVLTAIQAHRDTWDGPEGMLEQIIRHSPELTNRARAQEIEHAVLLSEAALLEAALRTQIVEDAIKVPQLRDRASMLIERLRDHVARSSDLIYDAFFSDLGGES